jgi:hypothetical protein
MAVIFGNKSDQMISSGEDPHLSTLLTYAQNSSISLETALLPQNAHKPKAAFRHHWTLTGLAAS